MGWQNSSCENHHGSKRNLQFQCFNLIPIKIHKNKENTNTCIKPEKKLLYCQGNPDQNEKNTGRIAFQVSKIYYSAIVIGTT